MVQKRYSDILADIVENKNTTNNPGQCTCPVEYFVPTLTKKPGQGCCQFGPDCKFISCDNPQPVACQYNQVKCTCYAQCICGPQSLPEPPVQLLQSPQLCTCGPTCPCESEVSLTSPTCDRTRCVCDVCLCQPTAAESKLLPTHFRNAIKKDHQITADERIKLECAEIKQLLVEHEESKKRELEETTIVANEKINKKGPRVSIVNDHVGSFPLLDNKEGPSAVESLILQEGPKSPELTMKTPKESVKSPKSTQKSPKKTKSQKPKVKQIKPAPILSKSTAPSAYTQYSCGCRMPKIKPLHMRYYYSGGTEHYGVKLGHKRCMPKVSQVPRHMGWLWNIEDPSKGIRERKGWPPGFIAKNIKNMMKVLKQLESGDPMLTTSKPPHSELGAKKFRRRVVGDVEIEPQEEPPLLHIHKKGRTYNITFCPKSSDTDIGPIPIPFSITEKRRDSDSASSDSTLEFEFHSPKPKRPPLPAYLLDSEDRQPEEGAAEPSATETAAPPSTAKTSKKKPNKKRSIKSTEENKNLWEEQQTQIENIA